MNPKIYENLLENLKKVDYGLWENIKQIDEMNSRKEDSYATNFKETLNIVRRRTILENLLTSPLIGKYNIVVDKVSGEIILGKRK